MKREYVDYLRDMLENAEKACTFIRDLDYDGFCKDDKALYTVVRALEIIGEAARQVPDDVCERV
ncbi:MAG: HepT-like ribonuclease domain-containing protein [Anaerolineales bacterium]